MSQHPTKEELSGFLLGKLAAPASDAVAEHIDECPPCQNTLSELSSQFDTLVKGLQKPAPSEVDSIGREAVKEVAAKAPRTTPAATPPASKPQSPLKQAEQPQLSQMGTSGGTVISRDAFRTSLISSGICDADDFADLERKHPPVAQAADGRELARALVQCGALSKYQATAVYQGKLKGLVYGEYAVVDLLGEGGMGQVFKARHRSMDRIVALKVLAKAAVGSPDAVKRFQREVKAAAKLIHPNIVTAFDASKHDGTHYLVMEFVPGSDLSAVVKKQGPLPIAQAVNYTIQAARGLAFAHSKGVVHRDIKPANLLVDGEGVVKILDMGLARLELEGADAGAGHGLTQTGQIMGTVDYMAPEQAFDTSKADAKADVYSLGCTLYRLLTGGNVFGGDTLMQKLLAHREQPTPSLRSVRPEVSAELDAIFLRMMAKQPQDRPTMTELIAELEALDRGEATAAFVPTSIAKDSQSGSLFAVKPITTVGKKELPQNTISLVASAVKPAGHGKKPPSNRLVLGAAAAGAAALCLWAIIVQFKDKHGNVIAEASVPNAASASVVVTPDVGSSSATSGVSPTDSGLPKIDYALERKVAQWLLDHGLVTILNVAGKRVTLTPDMPLPTEPFYVDQLHKSLRGTIPRDELLAGLADFRRLSRFSGNHLPSRDGDLWAEVYGTLPTVTSVNAAYSDWTDAGAAHLARLPNLHYVNFGNCPNITARGLFALRASTRLETIEVDEKQLAAGKYTLVDVQQLQDALPTTRFYLNGYRPIPGLKPAGAGAVVGGSSSPASTAAARWPYDPADGLEYVWSAPENLGPGVNGESRDMNPRLTDDELTLIFNRDFELFTARRSHRDEPFAACERLAGTIQDLKYEESSMTGDGLELYLSNTGASRHIWLAKRAAIDQPFGDPVKLGPPVNVSDENLSPVVSSNGLRLAIYSARGQPHIATRLFERDTRSEPFREALHLDRSAGLEKGRVNPAWISTDGRVLLTMVMYGDAWPHYWHVRGSSTEKFSPGMPYGEPFGGRIGPGNAWVSPDGQRMYFHSRELAGGRGNLDLWMVRRVPKPGTSDAARWPYDPADGREYVWSAPGNLGPGVNYGQRDLHPRLTDDELTLIYYRDSQLMTARRKHRDETFGPGEPLVGKVQDLKSEGMSITGDGLELFLYNTVGSRDVWSAKRSSLDQPFGDPVRLEPPVNTEHDDQYPTISADGLSLFVTSGRSDMRRTAVKDVFLFQRKSRSEPFGPPILLGRDVNPQDMIVSSWVSSDLRVLLTTVIKPLPWLYHWHGRLAIDKPYSAGTSFGTSLIGPLDTGSPWVSPDGQRMYFHSRTIPGGHGELDLWMVRRVPKPGMSAAATSGPGKLFMHDPGFPQWVKNVQAMPAERQIEEVRKKLVELNPGFDGALWGYSPEKPIVIRDGRVTEIGMHAEFITDISPLRALTSLEVVRCSVAPGHSGRFSDLSPVAGMRLRLLYLTHTAVRDLTPIRGMSLSNLFIDGTLVSDLAPLTGMPLIKVTLDDTVVSDLTPLHGCRTLREVSAERTKAAPEEIAALRQALPQARITADAPPAPKPSPSPTGTN